MSANLREEQTFTRMERHSFPRLALSAGIADIQRLHWTATMERGKEDRSFRHSESFRWNDADARPAGENRCRIFLGTAWRTEHLYRIMIHSPHWFTEDISWIISTVLLKIPRNIVDKFMSDRNPVCLFVSPRRLRRAPSISCALPESEMQQHLQEV